MRRFLTLIAVSGLLITGPITLVAHPGHDASGSKLTVTGEVIDPVCYLSHAHATGAAHATCATACAKNGNALAILDAGSGDIYLSLPAGHGDPNRLLLPYVGQSVKATGKMYRKGGLTGLSVESVEPAKP